MINRLLTLLLVGAFLFSCKGQKSSIGDDQSEKPSAVAPADLNPNEGILTLEIVEVFDSSVKANLISVDKMGFGFSAALSEGQEVDISDAPDSIQNGDQVVWVVEYSDDTPSLRFVRNAE